MTPKQIPQITFTNDISTITPAQLTGFFVGWPSPPPPEKHLEILRGSAEVILAIDSNTNQVVGFINALTDGELMAFIPLLEVLPDYQKQGIGKQLVTRMLEKLKSYYSVDLVCDPGLIPFYKSFPMHQGNSMMIRCPKATEP